jgi:predicted hydrocarbon binding protein
MDAARVARLVERLLPVFADASVGVFTRDVDVPEGEDDLTPVYVGVQVILEVIRAQLIELQELNSSLERKVAVQGAALQRATVARPFVRRIVRELCDRAGIGRAALHDVGLHLARGTDVADIERALDVFEEMGLGRLEMTPPRDGRFVFMGTDLIERREGARMTTCFLAAGYLAGAVSRLHADATVLGAEIECQSRGDAKCRFAVQVRAAKA